MVSVMFNICYKDLVFEVSSSSKSILIGGEISSSYWPDFTFHKKAIKKIPAMEILAINRIIMTFMIYYSGSKLKLVTAAAFDTSHSIR